MGSARPFLTQNSDILSGRMSARKSYVSGYPYSAASSGVKYVNDSTGSSHGKLPSAYFCSKEACILKNNCEKEKLD